MKVAILCNPTAGRGKARRALGKALEVLRRHGVEAQVRESQDSQHLLDLTRQVREERPDIVVSAGGDGTFHYVLNGLVGSDIPIGLLPIGSGNDFALGVGVPLEPRAAAQVLFSGEARRIDLARVGSAVYGSIAGVGFDTVVTRYANERVRHLRGSVAYLWAILRCLGPYRPQPLEVRSDGKNFSGEVMFAVVGNSTSYGGGLKMTPRASLDDGLLDVCIVPVMDKLELLRWVPRAYHGAHLAHPRVIYFQARKISLSSSSPLELFGDGEFMQNLPATVEVVPRALCLIVPRKENPAWAAGAPRKSASDSRS